MFLEPEADSGSSPDRSSVPDELETMASGPRVFGLKHAAGNMWKWCLNISDTNENWRVMKGGGFVSEASLLRLGGRSAHSYENRNYTHGCRVFIVMTERR